MEDLEHTLQRLAATFTVKDIMVPEERLTCGSSESSALRKLKEYAEFDVIPIRRKGNIRKYVDRDSGKLNRIELEDVISDGTSIFDLVDILKDRKFCFVITEGRIGGYVHFSDLNNGVVKIPFFVILENLERQLVDEIKPLVNADNLGLVLSGQRIAAVKSKMENMNRKRADYGWTSLLYFKEIVQFAIEFGIIKVGEPNWGGGSNL
jgi:hypothetical protein